MANKSKPNMLHTHKGALAAYKRVVEEQIAELEAALDSRTTEAERLRAVVTVAEDCVERMLQTNIGRVEPLITAVLDYHDEDKDAEIEAAERRHRR